MSGEEEKNLGGRPKKEIDYATVEKLASIMCTQEEIASFLDISVRTLLRDERFCQIYKKGMDQGKMSLRRKQFGMSDTNPTMAIWLGKQYLGQSDKRETTNTSTISLNMSREEMEAEAKRLEMRLGINEDE